jgi:hypothetical protein
MRRHQADVIGAQSILSEDIEWQPFPAFPPSACPAVGTGDPTRRLTHRKHVTGSPGCPRV